VNPDAHLNIPAEGVVITVERDASGNYIGKLWIDGERKAFATERRPGCAARTMMLAMQGTWGPPSDTMYLTVDGW
jgi:hypothetical protein